MRIALCSLSVAAMLGACNADSPEQDPTLRFEGVQEESVVDEEFDGLEELEDFDIVVEDAEPSFGIPNAHLHDFGEKTIWPGCLGGSASFSDTVDYQDGGVFLGGDTIVWSSSRTVGPKWGCPQLPSWVWHHATIKHYLKWTSLDAEVSAITLKSKGFGVSVKLKNGLLEASWTDYVTNSDWVFGPKKTWAKSEMIRAVYGWAIRMRAEHRATVTFYGPNGHTMTFQLEDHKEQWG